MSLRTRNELGRVLELISDFERAGTSRGGFARRHRLHPSALSRILRVGALPQELLSELSTLPRLSRTHLEVIATAPPERRAAILAEMRAGRSTYRIRARRETTAVPFDAAGGAGAGAGTGTGTGVATGAATGTATGVATGAATTGAATATATATGAVAPTDPPAAAPAPGLEIPGLAPIARALGATDEEALLFAGELLQVLWRSSRSRLEESFEAFRAARA